MNAETKSTNANETGTRDDIEQVMQEIENLQDEMENLARPPSATPVPASPPNLVLVSSVDDVPSPAPEPVTESEPTEELSLKEFASSGSGEPPLEESITELKDSSDENPNGAGLLASASTPTPTPTPEAAQVAAPHTSSVAPTPVPDMAPVPPPAITGEKALNSTASSVLSMTIQGQMAVQLNYGQNGEWIGFEFNDEMVTIQLANGTLVRLPRTH